MNILLVAVNAKYIHSNLAVYSLKAAAGDYASSVELAEYTINQQTDDIFRSICQKEPELLFFSCYIWNREIVVEAAENIHKVLPGARIWAGGPEVSYDAELFLKDHPQFTGVMKGEGEETFRRVLRHYLEQAEALEDIPGITFRRAPEGAHGKGVVAFGSREMDSPASGGTAGEIVSTLPGAPMKTLDGLPFVYQDMEEFRHKIIYYETSRGCPFSCSYCLSSIDKRVRFRSLELVKKELAFFLEHQVPQVKFVDRTFNCSHSHAMAIWQFLLEHDNGVTNFHFEIAADILTDEETALLARMRPGLVQLEIGVQSVNPRTLEAIHRTAEFSKIAARVRQIGAGRNIHQHLDLIAGLPYEDFESFSYSFDQVYGLKPQELQLGFLKVLRGSRMHRQAEEYGIVYRSRPPYEVLSTQWISFRELLRLKEVEEMLEVYYNSQQFRNTMESLEKQFRRPFAMYEALADYYKAHEPEGKSYSRQQRFAVLRAFIYDRFSGESGIAAAETDTGRAVAETDIGIAAAETDTGTAAAEADTERAVAETDTGIAVAEADTERAAAEADTERAAAEADTGTAGDSSAEGMLEYFDQLLTLDFYLRENAKTRPFWAEDLRPFRDAVGDFYRQEEKLPRYLTHYRGMTWKQMMRMTHLEHFTWDVLGDGSPGDCWVLFDYERRDPLTGDASVRRLYTEA